MRLRLVASISSIFVWMTVLACWIGCESPRDVADGSGAEGQVDDLAAEEIMSAVLQQYQAARTYQDKAVLYLSYRLEGRAIQEPHPWSISWDRTGRLAADLFNAKIRNDGQKLSCYIFDIETGNIDNQHLLVDAQPLGSLLEDPIASHFIFGTSELPLYEAETALGAQLIPPMVGFAESQLLPRWLTKPDQARRLEDDDSIGEACYVVQLVEDKKVYRVWVNQHSGVIEQLQLPFEFLDSQILGSDQVTDLQFFVRFHDATINGNIDPQRFDYKDRLAAKIVRQFVTLPERLPCEKLGQQVRDLPLKWSDGSAFEFEPDTGPLTLLWGVGADVDSIVKQLEPVLEKLDGEVVFVYSDNLLAEPASENIAPVAAIADRLKQLGIKSAYDPQMRASGQIELKSVPSFIVVDDDSTVQFAKHIDGDQWTRELQVAMKRVAGGENVAAEMKREYQQFLDSYHQQIAGKAVANSGDDASVSANSIGVAGTSRSDFKRLRSIAKLAWESAEFKNPGNIHLDQLTRNLFVIDGWQTIVELDWSGEIVRRKRLDIPDDAAVNRIRSGGTQQQKYFAAFAMLGSEVFLFDDEFNRIRLSGQQEAEFDKMKISECRFVDDGGEMSLQVSTIDAGMFEINPKTGQLSKLSNESSRGFCRLSGKTFSMVEDGLEIDGEIVDALQGWRINAIAGLPDPRGGCLVTGRNLNGNWQMALVGLQGRIVWQESIGSQYFETVVQPIVVGKQSQGVALCSQGELLLFDASGVNQRLAGGQEFYGLAYESQSRRLLISDGKRVRAWTLSDSRPTFLPASTPLNDNNR